MSQKVKTANMAELARAANKSRSTIEKYAKQGILPFSLNERGHKMFELDASLALITDRGRLHKGLYNLERAVADLGLSKEVRRLELERDQHLGTIQALKERLAKFKGGKVSKLTAEVESLEADKKGLETQLSIETKQRIAFQAKSEALEASVISLQRRYKPAVDMLLHGKGLEDE